MIVYDLFLEYISEYDCIQYNHRKEFSEGGGRIAYL